MLSKGPKWPLGAEAPALSASTQAPFNLPLLFANTWLSSEWERQEGASHFLCAAFFSFFMKEILHPHTVLSLSPSGYLVQPNQCAYRELSLKRGCPEMKDVEGVTADNGMKKWRRWKRKMKSIKGLPRWEKREKARHIALHFVSRCYERQMKSEACQVKESKTLASLLKWTEERHGEGRGRETCFTSPSQQMLLTVKRIKTPCIRILQAEPFKVVRSLYWSTVSFQQRENVSIGTVWKARYV